MIIVITAIKIPVRAFSCSELQLIDQLLTSGTEEMGSMAGYYQ